MTREEIIFKLDAVLRRLGMDVKDWGKTISCFRAKLELLSRRRNYNELLKSLFSSNDLSEFNSYVFEAMFAYDFESKNKSLLYEINQIPNEGSSIDFCYQSDGNTIYFELRLIQQRNWLTTKIESQLLINRYCETILDGSDEANEAIRIQNLILSKCQKADGTPTKFYTQKNDSLNFIVVNISELHLGMIDKADCLLPLYGDISIPTLYRRGIFGMWQVLPENSSEIENKCYKKFNYFRNTIHGVLFVRHVKDIGCLRRMYIDREFEYYLILNDNLLSKETIKIINDELATFLLTWPDK